MNSKVLELKDHMGKESKEEGGNSGETAKIKTHLRGIMETIIDASIYIYEEHLNKITK